MTGTYSKLASGSVALTGLAIVAANFTSRVGSPTETGTSSIFDVALMLVGICAVLGLGLLIHRSLLRGSVRLSALAEQQNRFLDSLPMKLIPLAIVAYAGLSLFLELAVIRWQGAAVSILAFYKNYSLLSAFAGLGLGYALFRRKEAPLFFVVPMLGVQLVLFWALRTPAFAGNLQAIRVNPFAEQETMGVTQTASGAEFASVYLILAAVFFATALAFIPIGQVVGRLMGRTENLRGYGLNLVGSLAGVAAMYLLSVISSPPSVWFAIAFLGLIPLLIYAPKLAAATAGVAAVVVLVTAIPPSQDSRDVYSPYQLLEHSQTSSGDLVVRAGGHFLLTATDLSDTAIAADPGRADLAAYYEFPYRAAGSTDRVLVVGAGAGNDVAAGLRVGADHIDAVEIDPQIVSLGRAGHPEQPYDDPRVHVVVDDARSYVSNATERYDLIVYGLLDSHSVVSHGSSVRLDSFVYTIEGLREARSRLAPGGVLSLSFAAFNTEIAGKLSLMLTEASDGIAPLAISKGGHVIFLHGNPRPPEVSSELLTSAGMTRITTDVEGLSQQVDPATDDWPFLYMTQRTYPVSYIAVVLLVATMSAALIWSFLGDGLEVGNAGFFFLGAGFLLIETKGITELGLAFGNTWQVVGIVIGAVLVMGYIANLIVARFPAIRMTPVIILLLLSIAIGFTLSFTGAIGSDGLGAWLALAVLTLPVLFSGLAFSLGLKVASSLPGVLAANLSGAVAGGLIEYNSMAFGFRSLYIMAAALYTVAGILLVRKSRRPASVGPRKPQLELAGSEADLVSE